jgi:hypothetical protein
LTRGFWNWKRRAVAKFHGPDVEAPDSDNWYHVDQINNDIFGINPLVKVDGLPDSLITTLDEWVTENEQEARDWLAASAEPTTDEAIALAEKYKYDWFGIRFARQKTRPSRRLLF